MIGDSAALRGQVRWYTSLLGRKASLKPLLAAAHAAGACHVTHTEIAQGNTSRWALGWSFVADAAPLLAKLAIAARRSSAEHLIATKALRLHSYGLDSHCR